MKLTVHCRKCGIQATCDLVLTPEEQLIVAQELEFICPDCAKDQND